MRYRKFASLALASTIVAGSFVWSAAAGAQTAEGASAPTEGGLADIIVTAQRRGQNLQDVPIAVNVLSADTLQAMGGASSEDLSLVPGLVYTPHLAGGGISIRGISGTNGGTDEPGNAIYVDGVYQYAASASLFQFNAIERVEVLKGPQGTLFGRNTAGGVIQVITRDPGRELASDGEFGYANYDTVSGKFYLSVPITDTLAANIAAFGNKQSKGWGRNITTGDDVHLGYSWGVRGKIKWVAPSGNTDIVLAGVYSGDKPVASSGGEEAPGTFNILGQPGAGFFNSDSDFDEYRTVKEHSFSGTLHQSLGFAKLMSITAYDKVDAFVLSDADGTALPILQVRLRSIYTTFTQEVQLQSQNDSRLNWIIGGFYMSAKTSGRYRFGPNAVLTDLKTHSYAGFGQATYALTDDTKLTAGIRYTTDKRDLFFFGSKTSKKDSKPSWRLAIDHKISPEILAYASYSRGFKSGVFNATSPNRPPAGPTSLDAYEVGLKSQGFDNRLRVNAAVFYYKYRDIQIELFDQVTNTAYFANAGAARSYGIDLDVAAQPTEALTLTGNVALLNAKFTSSTPTPCYVANPAPVGGLTVNSCSPDGNRLPYSPKFTITLNANYKYETSVGRFDIAGTYGYNDGYFTSPSNFVPTSTKAFDTVNASLRWTSTSGHLNAGVWGKSLLNQRRISGALLGAGISGTTSFALPPRTYGVTIGYKY